MPVSVGSSLRSWLKASRPPAEAPIPTIGNAVLSDDSDGTSACGDSGGEGSPGKGLVWRFGVDPVRRGTFRPITPFLPFSKWRESAAGGLGGLIAPTRVARKRGPASPQR